MIAARQRVTRRRLSEPVAASVINTTILSFGTALLFLSTVPLVAAVAAPFGSTLIKLGDGAEASHTTVRIPVFRMPVPPVQLSVVEAAAIKFDHRHTRTAPASAG